MIVYKTGSLFDSNCDCYVNTVNCIGVMGKGIALEFKKRYPKSSNRYIELCKKNYLQPGGTLLTIYPPEPIIIHVATKNHWRNPSQIDWIKNGLGNIVSDLYNHEHNISSIALPQLGCGNGGLKWSDVQPLMEQYLDPLDILVEIYI